MNGSYQNSATWAGFHGILLTWSLLETCYKLTTNSQRIKWGTFAFIEFISWGKMQLTVSFSNKLPTELLFDPEREALLFPNDWSSMSWASPPSTSWAPQKPLFHKDIVFCTVNNMLSSCWRVTWNATNLVFKSTSLGFVLLYFKANLIWVDYQA